MRKAEAVRGVCMGDLTGEGVSEESCGFHLPTAAGGYAARKPWQPGELLCNGRSGLVQGPALESETAAIPKAKKTDVVERPEAFDHVGLLVNGPPGRTGLPFG